jgi:hypothetical protein
VRGAGDEVVLALLRWAPLLGAGNPLFAIQVVRNLELEGYLRRTRAGTFELAVGADVEYRAPASVSDVIDRGLSSLSPEALGVLGVAALFGRQFLPEDLRALGLFDEGAVDRALCEASAHYLCVVDGSGNCSFTHDSARELTAASVPVEVRPQHHRAIARRIEERGGDSGTLAHHLDRAGEIDRAAEAYLSAALEADRLQDPLGASRRLRRALTLLDPLPLDPVRTELRARAAYQLARVDCLLGSTTEPLAVLRTTARALPEGPLVTAALSSALARVYYVRGEFVDAVAHSRQALAAVGNDAALRPYACLPANILGRALAATGKVGPAIAPLTRGCELAAAAGEYAELCHSRGILCVAQSQAGFFAEAEQSVARAGRHARRRRDTPRRQGTGL